MGMFTIFQRFEAKSQRLVETQRASASFESRAADNAKRTISWKEWLRKFFFFLLPVFRALAIQDAFKKQLQKAIIYFGDLSEWNKTHSLGAVHHLRNAIWRGVKGCVKSALWGRIGSTLALRNALDIKRLSVFEGRKNYSATFVQKALKWGGRGQSSVT